MQEYHKPAPSRQARDNYSADSPRGTQTGDIRIGSKRAQHLRLSGTPVGSCVSASLCQLAPESDKSNIAHPPPNKMHTQKNNVTRRSFIKKTALTSGAIAVLSQGVSLAAEEDMSSGWGKCKKNCDNNPTQTGYGFAHDTRDPAINPQPLIYFKVVTCKCTNGHTMGEFFKDPRSTPYTDSLGTIITHSSKPGLTEHTTSHGPCGK